MNQDGTISERSYQSPILSVSDRNPFQSGSGRKSKKKSVREDSVSPERHQTVISPAPAVSERNPFQSGSGKKSKTNLSRDGLESPLRRPPQTKSPFRAVPTSVIRQQTRVSKHWIAIVI
jgi:hypothetical protein